MEDALAQVGLRYTTFWFIAKMTEQLLIAGVFIAVGIGLRALWKHRKDWLV